MGGGDVAADRHHVGVLADAEVARFLDLVQRLPRLAAAELFGLTVTPPPGYLDQVVTPKGLF